MRTLEQLTEVFPEGLRDIKLNLKSVLAEGAALSSAQKWGVAVASAAAARNPELLAALVAEARQQVPAAVIDDALAAAAIMSMNNVYYRFRHLIKKPTYQERPPRLRMNRLAKPQTSKVDFELFSLAVSAINACETCVQAHENVVLNGGLSEDLVHDAVRIAASVQAAAVSLELIDEWNKNLS